MWTIPSKLEVSHRWLIHDIDVLKTGRDIKLGFTSISNRTIYLQAMVKRDSLVLGLLKDSDDPSVIAVDCKFFYPGKGTSDSSLSLADHKIAHNGNNPGVYIPLTEVRENSLPVKFEGILLSEDYKRFSVKKPSPVQWPFKWMVKLFNEKSYSDAQIQVGEEVFLVHRVILAAASPVFHAMFESEMQERSGIIKISDFDSAVVSNLLAFIYTDEAPNLEMLAKELLLAADKYDIQELVFVCMKYLQTALTLSNVVEVLVLAEKLPSDNSLRNACIKYIQGNLDSVCESKSWKLLEETSKDLVMETM